MAKSEISDLSNACFSNSLILCGKHTLGIAAAIFCFILWNRVIQMTGRMCFSVVLFLCSVRY